ncbi:MAG: cyclic nucleotide-binding domain-containing protein, partial [Caldilineae bacterium]
MNAAAAPNRLNAQKRDLLAAMPQWQGAPLDEVLDLLEPETEVIDAQQGQVLVRQGEKAENIYYIVSAEVTETREKETNNGHREVIIHRTLGPGRLVGGLALFYNLAHTGTAKITKSGLLLRISTVALDRVLYRYPRLRDNMAPLARINRLRTMPYLAPVKSLVLLGYLAEEVQVRSLQENEIIYTDKTTPEHVHLIHKGQVCLFFPHRSEVCKRLLGTGGAFGFPGSVPGRSNAANGYGHWARAVCTTELYLLAWAHMKRLARFYPQLQTPTVQETPALTLHEVPVFAQLTHAQREELAGYCSFQHIPQYHLLVQQGDFMDSMWILLKDGRA